MSEKEAPMNPMMKCGHAANARNGQGKPSCVICVGLHPGAEIIDDSPPKLEGRKARCPYACGSIAPSSTDLAFFEHKPSEEYDRYYCGCRGWN